MFWGGFCQVRWLDSSEEAAGIEGSVGVELVFMACMRGNVPGVQLSKDVSHPWELSKNRQTCLNALNVISRLQPEASWKAMRK